VEVNSYICTQKTGYFYLETAEKQVNGIYYFEMHCKLMTYNNLIITCNPLPNILVTNTRIKNDHLLL